MRTIYNINVSEILISNFHFPFFIYTFSYSFHLFLKFVLEMMCNEMCLYKRSILYEAEHLFYVIV